MRAIRQEKSERTGYKEVKLLQFAGGTIVHSSIP